MTKLETFLRKKRVWTKFKRNVIKQHGARFLNFCLRNSVGSEFAFHDSFLWGISPEGHEFWEALAQEYTPILTLAK